MPAFSLDDAGPYLAATYLVFLVLVLVYVGIMAGRLSRMERDITELNDLLDHRERDEDAAAEEPEKVLK